MERVDDQEPDADAVGRGQCRQDRVAHEEPADARALRRAVDRKPTEQHRGDRVRCVPARSAGQVFMLDGDATAGSVW